ncbi:MAG: hypothetical protein V4438_01355 [Patescibacteria group bacterium]
MSESERGNLSFGESGPKKETQKFVGNEEALIDPFITMLPIEDVSESELDEHKKNLSEDIAQILDWDANSLPAPIEENDGEGKFWLTISYDTVQDAMEAGEISTQASWYSALRDKMAILGISVSSARADTAKAFREADALKKDQDPK